MSEQINYNQDGQQFNLKLFINNIQVPTKNIVDCSIREWITGTVVTLECTFLDSGTFTELSPLYDECPVTLEYCKNDQTEYKKIEFQMNPYEKERTALDNGAMDIIHFVAFQKSKDFFFPIHSRVFRNSTTTEVLQNISKESGFKFKKEIESNDIQNWMQGNCDNFTFTKHLMKRSYVKEEDLPIFYFNRSNEAIYSTIKTKCNNTTKFMGINNNYAFMDNGNSEFTEKMKQESKGHKNLFYYSAYSSKDIAALLNKRNGYGIDYTYFDYKDFREYKMAFKFSPLTGYVNQHKDNVGKYVNGLTYNSQHKNVHKNYLLAMSQNLFIQDVFYNNFLQVYVNPDEEVMIGDKVNMIIYDNVSKALGNSPNIDKVNSGDYIVGGILHNFKKDGLYNMCLTLFRNGMNDSEIKTKTFELIEGDY